MEHHIRSFPFQFKGEGYYLLISYTDMNMISNGCEKKKSEFISVQRLLDYNIHFFLIHVFRELSEDLYTCGSLSHFVASGEREVSLEEERAVKLLVRQVGDDNSGSALTQCWDLHPPLFPFSCFLNWSLSQGSGVLWCLF